MGVILMKRVLLINSSLYKLANVTSKEQSCRSVSAVRFYLKFSFGTSNSTRRTTTLIYTEFDNTSVYMFKHFQTPTVKLGHRVLWWNWPKDGEHTINDVERKYK